LKTTRPKTSFRPALSRELAKLRAHVAETEEMHRAIRTGEVDTMVVAGKRGPHVFTLKGSEHAYRVLIESMNEGALTVTADKLILYANQAFARMVKCPLEQVTGSSFRRFLSAEDRAALRPLLRRADHSGAKIQVLLNAGDGSQMPVQISIRPLPKNGFKSAPIGLVVTDMTAARRSEELLCAILVRSQTLADHLLARDGPAKKEAMKLREMLGEAAEEVERISRNLRPGILEQLGLVAVLSDTTTEFAKRTGVSLKLACAPLAARLPGDIELTFFRILQEALKNVEKHARARRVSVCLTQSDNFLQLVINDDGVGFNPNHRANGRKGKGGLGLLGMRERATYVGGEFRIKSIRGAGTEIEVRIPLPPKAAKAGDARRKLKTGG
jgi:PAS domain S-box-containing protein